MRRDTCTTCGGLFKTDQDGLWVLSGATRQHAEPEECIEHLTVRINAAEEAMKAAASLPGRLWLTGQLALAEFLSGEGGENLDYALEQYEAAQGGGE